MEPAGYILCSEVPAQNKPLYILFLRINFNIILWSAPALYLSFMGLKCNHLYCLAVMPAFAIDVEMFVSKVYIK